MSNGIAYARRRYGLEAVEPHALVLEDLGFWCAAHIDLAQSAQGLHPARERHFAARRAQRVNALPV